jgi:hypothetical protein
MAVSAMRHVLEDNKEGHDIEVMLIFLPDVDRRCICAPP